MRCREHEDTILDVARGAAGEPDGTALLRHAGACAACAARLQQQRALTAGLHALDASTPGEGPSPGVEAALLAAFALRPPPARAKGRAVTLTGWRPWFAAAAALVLLTLATVMVPREGREPRAGGRLPLAARPLQVTQAIESLIVPVEGYRARLDALEAANAGTAARVRAVPARDQAPGAFMPWPGATALPVFENGELVRTELPASVLPLLGIAGASAPAGETVAVDVVVGQDGFARAVRLAR